LVMPRLITGLGITCSRLAMMDGQLFPDNETVQFPLLALHSLELLGSIFHSLPNEHSTSKHPTYVVVHHHSWACKRAQLHGIYGYHGILSLGMVIGAGGVWDSWLCGGTSWGVRPVF
jgi:hypothetical protein